MYESRKFACTQCGQHVEADVSFAGQVVQCPCCGQPMRIPQRQHFLVTRPQRGVGRRLMIWALVILVMIGGWYLAARQSWVPWIQPITTTTTINGREYPVRHLAPKEIAALIQLTLDPPAMSDPKVESRFNLTFRDDSMTSTVHYDARLARSDAELRSFMGEPSRIIQDGKDATDPAAGSAYQLHYYYRTGHNSEMVVVIPIRGDLATGASVTGSFTDMATFSLGGFVPGLPAKAN